MGEENDSQRMKRIAATAYDYDIDPRWAEYWSNILIPPHMASRSDVVDHYKRKFYQRYIDPDFIVQPMSSTSSSQTSRASERSSSTPIAEAARQSNSGSRSGTSAPQDRGSSSLQMNKRTTHFALNAWVFFMAMLGILPLVPTSISSRAYRLSLLGNIVSSLYSVYTRAGMPRAWNQPAIQTWLQSVIVTKEFIQFSFSLMFITSQLPFKFALIPVLCWSIEHVTKFLRHNFAHTTFYRKFLDEPCLWVELNTTTLGMLSSNVEVALGFLLIISLFSWQRSIIHTFMYWQLLKLMYHVPATAAFHQGVWSKIGRTTMPYIHRYTPFLITPISAIQRWWLR
ncbi:hypothetical protein AXF42_Ash003245 [Apostasia shenzhenica]|uniref:Uncharacterized protein n=1 Tax=Apostasia shenzhenica TaxID=1088818 RepID=A0A2I0BFM0_9ASPA|nr:hypothetical protein AXF42_Ash003245 [Apostasia shenzhenica]